jgi:predicted RNA-binding protein associated with RNAse of E/G family
MGPLPIEVVKLDHTGGEVFRYPGRVLARTPQSITLEAFFSQGDTAIGEVVLQHGDRFVETFYTDRWYNIFEIYGRDTDKLKAYYCNIGHPAQIENGMVSYRDLALDVLALPDGRRTLLDEEEFLMLDLTKDVRRKALAGLAAAQEELREKIQEQG